MESRAGAPAPTERARSRERVLLGVILLAGLALRLLGTYWDLPKVDQP